MSRTLADISEVHAQGFNCAQVVFSQAAEKLGFSKEQALKIASPFGGGMYHGETCGCVTGALMAIGLQAGNGRPFDTEAKLAMIKKKEQFEELFLEEYESLICKELLGADLSTPEGKAEIAERGGARDFCEEMMLYCCGLLDQLL